MNKDSIRNGKEVRDMTQTLLQVKKEEMAEEMADHTVTEDMRETIRKLNMEITLLKSDLHCLHGLHKSYVKMMQKSFQDAMNLLSNKTRDDEVNSDQQPEFIQEGNSDQEPDSVPENMGNSDQEPHSVPENMENSDQEPDIVPENMENSDQEPDGVPENMGNSGQEPDSVLEDTDLLTDNRRSFNQQAVTDHIYCLRQAFDHTYSLQTLEHLSLPETMETDDKIATDTDNISISMKEELVTDNEEILSPNINIGEIVVEESVCLDTTLVTGVHQHTIFKEKQNMNDTKSGIYVPLVPIDHPQHVVLKLSENWQNILANETGASSSNNLITSSNVQRKNEGQQTQSDVLLNFIIPKMSYTDHQLLPRDLINKDSLVEKSESVKANTSSMEKGSLVEKSESVKAKTSSMNKNIQKMFKQKKGKIKPVINPLTGKPYQNIRPKPGSDATEYIPMDTDESDKEEIKKQNKEFIQRTDSKICFVCGKYFDKRNSMYAHLKTHEMRLFQCDKCDKSFKRKYHLEEHNYIHDSAKTFVCELCGKSVRYYSSFLAHKKRHKKDYRVPCDICNKHFMDKSTMLRHRARHESDLKFRCEICKVKYKDKCRFDKHLKEHAERPFECLDCNEVCTDAKSLTKHIIGHYDALPYGCGTCGKAFTKTEHLSKHVQQHMFRKSYKLFCVQCGFLFRTKSSFDEHQQRLHGMLVTCDDCGQNFPDVTERDNHAAIHTSDEPDVVFGCTYCNKGFTKSDHLKFHVQNKHSVNKK